MAAVAKAAGIPMVTSLYGVDAAVLPYTSRWRDQYARLFRDGDLFLAEAPEMRKKVIAAGAPVERTVLQPIAIDVRKYPAWRPDAAITVLFVGRFIEKKGLLDAIAAFSGARSRLPGARLTIIGDGPDENSARALVSRRGLTDVVEFVGTKPHADVIARLASARVLIHPSATAADGDSEGGAPTILLEAQAIGTPVVSTRHADIPYIAPDGPGVYLSDEHDVDALARDLVAAVESGKRSTSAHLKTRHDVSSAIASLESHYRAAIGRVPRAVAV
jgi:glycosyltransferase involved in cell wall biosynthesis